MERVAGLGLGYKKRVAGLGRLSNLAGELETQVQVHVAEPEFFLEAPAVFTPGCKLAVATNPHKPLKFDCIEGRGNSVSDGRTVRGLDCATSDGRTT